MSDARSSAGRPALAPTIEWTGQKARSCPALLGERAGILGLVEELGPPIAYLVLEEGTPVYDRRGERIGVVEHVVADEAADIFDGVIVHTLPLPGRHLFADVDQIAELHEQGVLLSVDRDALHEPGERSAGMDAHRDDKAERPLQARLRRAWDWISGRH